MSARVTLTAEEAVGWIGAVREACLAEVARLDAVGAPRWDVSKVEWVAYDVEQDAAWKAIQSGTAYRRGYAGSFRRLGEAIVNSDEHAAMFAGRAYLTIAAILDAVA